MLDLIGAVVGMSAVAINLVAFVPALSRRPALRLGIAAVAGGWVGLASSLGGSGLLAFTSASPVPLIGVLCGLPLLSVALLAWRSARVRARLLSLPLPLLVGVNSLRIFGVLFLLLAAGGRLGGPFPLSAGIGDILTGALAIPLALRLARAQPLPLAALRRWNLFGIFDLVVAVALGVTSANGSPLQLIHAGAGSEAIQYLPYCLIPTVLVPFYLITHGIVAAQLAVQRRAAPALAHA
jgi:hypothetical protein